MRDEACDIGNRGVVSSFERSVDRGKRKRPWVETAAGPGNRSHCEEVRSHVGILVGSGIGSAVVEYRAIVGAGLQGVLSLNPGYIVHHVVRRHVDDAGGIRGPAGTGGKSVDTGERDIVLVRSTTVAVTLPNKSVPQIMDDGVRNSPNVACRDALGIVVSRRVRLGARKLLGIYRPVVLKIAAHKYSLLGVQVVVELGDVCC